MATERVLARHPLRHPLANRYRATIGRAYLSCLVLVLPSLAVAAAVAATVAMSVDEVLVCNSLGARGPGCQDPELSTCGPVFVGAVVV
eukprot:3652042-Alexandrium_andersonii.AAC.1